MDILLLGTSEIAILLFGFPLITWLISTLVFSCVSLKYIEKKMAENDVETPRWDQKGWGFRISLYIRVLSRGKSTNNPLFNEQKIIESSRGLDCCIAKVSRVSGILTLISGIFIYFYFDIASKVS